MSTVEAVAVAPARRPSPRPAPRPAPASRPDHLRVVAPSERLRARRRLTPATGVLLTAVLFATLFLVAIAHTVLVQGQVRLDELDAKLSVEQARYQELRTEVAEMESPSRVVAAAEALGMVSPQDLVYLQPPASEPSTTATTPPAGSGEDASDLASGADNTWGVMKPLLETHAP